MDGLYFKNIKKNEKEVSLKCCYIYICTNPFQVHFKLWCICQCLLISNQKFEGRPNFDCFFAPQFMFSVFETITTLPHFTFQAYIHLNALLGLSQMTNPDFSIIASIAMFWWFDEVTVGFLNSLAHLLAIIFNYRPN